MTTEDKEYKVYPYRFVILILFMFISLMNQVLWITFAPIMNEIAGYYKGIPDWLTPLDSILLLSAIFMILYIPVNFPATYLIDKWGLKWGTGIGVILTGTFGLLRALSGTSYFLILVTTIMIGIGQPFLLNSFTKVAVIWFPENEKATATGLGTIAILGGIILGMILTPLIYESNGIDYILWAYGIVSFVAMILYLTFVKNRPDTPPSAIAGEKVFDFKGVKKLFKNRDFNFLLVLIFVGLGAFNAISAEIDVIFAKFTEVGATGLIGGMIIAGGIVGAGILSTLSDKYHKRKIFLVLAMLVSIPLTQLLLIIDSFTLVMILAFVFGFFLVSALPIGLVYATEITYPISEETSNGVMMTLGQIAGIIFLISFNMLVITILFGVALIFALLMKESTPPST